MHRHQGQYDHTFQVLSIETICLEDPLAKQTGISSNKYQYLHLNVLPIFEFLYCFGSVRANT